MSKFGNYVEILPILRLQ